MRAALTDSLFPELIKKGLNTRIVGRRIYYFPATDSTNQRALELALAGSPQGTVVVADRQLKGRGRSGRRWFSPGGGSLLLSIIFRPDLEPAELFRLSMTASLAVVRAIRVGTGLRSVIKWPNDIMINRLKVGGILVEFAPRRGRAPVAIVGIGINVNFNSSRLRSIRGTATSLSEEVGGPLSRLKILKILLREIDKGYRALGEGLFERTFRGWKGHLMGLGQRVRVNTPDGLLRGVVDGVEENGALVIRDRNNRRRAITEEVAWELRPSGRWPPARGKRPATKR